MASRGQRLQRLMRLLQDARTEEGRKHLGTRMVKRLETRAFGALLDATRITNDGSYSGQRSKVQPEKKEGEPEKKEE